MAVQKPSITYDAKGNAVAGIFEPALELTACVVAAASVLEKSIPLPNTSAPRLFHCKSNEVLPSRPQLNNIIECYGKEYAGKVWTCLISVLRQVANKMIRSSLT